MNTTPHAPQPSVPVPRKLHDVPDEDDEFDSDAGEVRRMIELNGMIGLDADAFLADAS